MKKILSLLILGIYLISISYECNAFPVHKKNIENSFEVFVVEELPSYKEEEEKIEENPKEEINENENKEFSSDNPISELETLENFKRIYLKIIENLSFRNTLWEQSSNFIKFDNKDEVATLWASGIRDKNGTLLYLVSNENIKSQLKNIFRDNPSWIIDQNNHVIESFKLSKGKKLSKNLYEYEITYKAMHRDGYQENLKQTLCVMNDKNDFKVSEFSNIIPKG